MNTFAFRINLADPDAYRVVDDWLRRVTNRLEGNNIVAAPFRGKIKEYALGLYVASVEPTLPRLLAWFFLLFFAGGGAFTGILGAQTLGTSIILFGALIWALWLSFYTRAPYVFMIWIQTRRLTGRWCSVKRADEEVLGRWLYESAK